MALDGLADERPKKPPPPPPLDLELLLPPKTKIDKLICTNVVKVILPPLGIL